jgi:hypothetical protein
VPVCGSMKCFSSLPAEFFTTNSIHLFHRRSGILVLTQTLSTEIFSKDRLRREILDKLDVSNSSLQIRTSVVHRKKISKLPLRI